MSDYINNEERRYKIQKKISYEEELAWNKKWYYILCFFFGVCILKIVLNFYSQDNNIQTLLDYADLFSPFLGASASMMGIITCITNKTKIEAKLEDIEKELESYNKGRVL